MSTKIYYAWRIPWSRFDQALEIAHDAMFRGVMRLVRQFLRKCSREDVLKYYVDLKAEDARITLGMKLSVVEDQLRNDGFELWKEVGCGWRIWFDGKHAYLIPWGSHEILGKMRLPKWFRDYSYWNNTDRPDRVTQREWDARQRTWERVVLQGDRWDRGRLDHVVMSDDAYGQQVRVRRELGSGSKTTKTRKPSRSQS